MRPRQEHGSGVRVPAAVAEVSPLCHSNVQHCATHTSGSNPGHLFFKIAERDSQIYYMIHPPPGKQNNNHLDPTLSAAWEKLWVPPVISVPSGNEGN